LIKKNPSQLINNKLLKNKFHQRIFKSKQNYKKYNKNQYRTHKVNRVLIQEKEQEIGKKISLNKIKLKIIK